MYYVIKVTKYILLLFKKLTWQNILHFKNKLIEYILNLRSAFKIMRIMAYGFYLVMVEIQWLIECRQHDVICTAALLSILERYQDESRNNAKVWVMWYFLYFFLLFPGLYLCGFVFEGNSRFLFVSISILTFVSLINTSKPVFGLW